MNLPELSQVCVGVIGLGYVGLPLAVAFANHFPTIGFDINPLRIDDLRLGVDRTHEVSSEELAQAQGLRFVSDPTELKACNTFIIAVPTPIDGYKQPDLGPLVAASTMVGQVMAARSVVIFESTVYPGATEEECIPVLEKLSGLRCNVDFWVGYSPERINPGDRTHSFSAIRKVTSGSTREAADFVDQLYSRVVTAGTFQASSIRVAEAAKVIENTQRDVNIALINELAILFNRMAIDTEEVLRAAGTKWNFLHFWPGLVGGHCIGVDPYYLTHKAQSLGYYPEVILAGRRINDGMGGYVADQVLRLMTRHRLQVVDSRILVLGLTFKENCPDLRNTRVIDIVRGLQEFNAHVDVHDPLANVGDARREYGIDLVAEPAEGEYDAVIVAVAHRAFLERGLAGIRRLNRPGGVVYDVKYLFPANQVDGRL